MSEHWSGTNYVSDMGISQISEKYTPIVEDISMDADTLCSAVEEIERSQQISKYV